MKDEFAKNWERYIKMLKNKEFDYFLQKDYYGAFCNGSIICIAPSEKEALEIAKNEVCNGIIMTQLLGGNIEKATFYEVKNKKESKKIRYDLSKHI
ncbi:MAG: hypothetical protein QW051_05035 [Candidatus Aenigmatarchaeota archaeon]